MASETAVMEPVANGPAITPPDGVRMTSESIVHVVAALSKAQAQVKEAKRNLTGHMPTRDGGYDYLYAGSDETYRATREAQEANGLCLFRRRDGDNLRVVLCHTSGEWLDFGLFPLGSCGTHQQLGGAMTYMCRYVECLVFKLAPEDDDGKAAGDALGQARDRRAPQSSGKQSQQQRREPPAKNDSTSPRAGRNPHETVSKFALPPHWPESSSEQLQNWVSGLKTSADFRTALGLFLQEPILMGDLVKWDPVCRHLHYMYHERLAKTTDERKSAAAEITRLVDDTLAKLELDLAAEELFSRPDASADEPPAEIPATENQA